MRQKVGTHMKQQHTIASGMAVLVVTGLTAFFGATPAIAEVPGAPPAAPKIPTAPIVWGECPVSVSATSPGMECGMVPVPLDYSNPEGERIELMVSRLASAAPSDRRGVLLLNPGGPGGSGLSMPTDLAYTHGMPADVIDSYDLIGMDTRGVGFSAPISCGFTTTQGFTGAVPKWAPDSDAVVAQAEVVKGVAEQCAANDVNGHLRHITTANMARDLDQIRIALGEEKASFFGVSYGSALGAAYASMFPDTTDRVILDSNIGDTHVNQDGFRRYAEGTEDTFPDFAKWAAERDGSYDLGDTPEEVRETYFELGALLDEKPQPGIDGHVFRAGTFAGLYAESSYPRTAALWQTVQRTAERGETAPAEPAGPAAPEGELAAFDNSWSVFQAVTCNDVDFPSDVSVYQKAVEEDRERFPIFGAATANITPCAFWAFEPSEAPVPINDVGPKNILVLQNERDPVTPLSGGELIREKFDQRSQLVTADRSGHGVYVFGDSPCVDEITSDFLVEGTLPRKDVRC